MDICELSRQDVATYVENDQDNGIKIGESETLFDPTLVNPAKAEELASIKSKNKQARIDKAKERV